WLERAAARLEREPALDVLAGVTTKPGGRPAHRQRGPGPLYLPTNPIVRRALFERAAGYCEAYFDPGNGVYFRADSYFGFPLALAIVWAKWGFDVRRLPLMLLVPFALVMALVRGQARVRRMRHASAAILRARPR